MRIALLAILLGACAGHGAPAPAWPKLHQADDDGGESLAPHVANAGSAGSAAPAAASAKADDGAAATPDTTASDATAQPADDSAGSGDDGTIEIDDDDGP